MSWTWGAYGFWFRSWASWFVSPGHEKRFEAVGGGCHFGLLNGFCGIDVFGTHHRAFADVRTFPDAFLAGNDVVPLLRAFISGIEIVAMAERDCSRADEVVFKAVHRARRIAEHAVDALAKLLVILELIRRLAVFALGHGLFLFSNEPRLDRFEFVHEVGHVDDEIADDGEVDQGIHANFVGIIVAQHRRASELGFAIDHHAATPAHAHSARPSKRKRAVDVVFDVVERVENDPVVPKFNLVRLLGRRVLFLRTIAQHRDFYGLEIAHKRSSLRCKVMGGAMLASVARVALLFD